MSKVSQTYAICTAHQDWSWAVGAGSLRIRRMGDAPGYYWLGEVVDQRGIATVYRQADYTRLDFVAGGRCHSRGWSKYLGDRTIRRLARAFITELLEREDA